jgi:UDP-glucose 4-epimerase
LTILILGSQGYIGSNLTDFFLAKGDTVYGCDIISYTNNRYKYQKISILSSDFDTLFSNQQFDVCINAAGSGSVYHSIINPMNDFEANTMSVAKVLDTIRKYQPHCKYLHISSAAVYGNPKKLPIKESDPLSPLSPYGYNKLMSEQLCKEYHQLYNLPITIIRPFSVYGNGLQKQLLWDICTKLKNADTIKLYGTGNESRDFIHITELVALINNIIEKSSFTCDTFNAATGIETTIKKIATFFENHFGGYKKITFSGEAKEGDPINWRADITALLAIGFAPTVNIELAIAEYIQWFASLKND